MGSRPGSIIEKLEFALFSMAYLKGPILRSQQKKSDVPRISTFQ